MAHEESSSSPNPFDVQTIKNLVALMSRHDLSEIDLRDGAARLRLRRGSQRNPNAAPLPMAPAPAPALPAPAPAAPASAAPAKEPAAPARNLTPIKSPTPGTFYTKPSPEADVFVRVGARVTPSTVVCIIEAMKIFNEITADCSGVVTEILVENQQPVEYGQVLFNVDPTA